MAEPAMKTDEEKEKQKMRRLNRKFAVIRFPGKIRKQDPDLIPVGVHGDNFHYKKKFKRNEYIPVPIAVIEALRNAKEPVVEDEDPTSPKVMSRRRKIVGFSPRFPFELLGYTTKENYEKLVKIATERSITDDELYDAIGE